MPDMTPEQQEELRKKLENMSPEELKESFPDPIGSFYFTDYASSYLSKIRAKERSDNKK